MASVSGTGSLGNTSLRGYGGLVSGIDRDQVIEQLTAATNAKITNKKSEMTKLSWKQEAFQSISNKILALQDNFMSYSSSSNLKDASILPKPDQHTWGFQSDKVCISNRKLQLS